MRKRLTLITGLLAYALAAQAGPSGAAPVGRDQVLSALASGAPLTGADVSGLPLAGLEFSGRDLARTRWCQADLRGARFTQCNLRDADFTGAALNGVTFQSCDLTGATFAAATLPGAYVGTCDLSGASFDKADTFGATLVDVTLFPTGASHLPAVAAAVELRGGPKLASAWLAAASGDAFAFTYDRNDRAAWVGVPMTLNPIVNALDTLGFDAIYRTGINTADGAQKEVASVLRRGLVAVLPLRLAGAGLRGNAVEAGVWVAAYDISSEKAPPQEVSVRTPFGDLKLPMDELLRRWEGPWPTLLPAGAGPFLARYPICLAGAQKAETSEAAIALAALRHASAIMNEPRSFGEAFGGFDAYRALIQDAADRDLAIGDLIHWSGMPRQQLAASRRLAAAFLRDAAPKLPEPPQGPLLDAATAYEEIASLLTNEWPLPSPAAFQGEKVTTAVDAAVTRRPYAKALLDEVLARERSAIALLEKAVAEAVKAG